MPFIAYASSLRNAGGLRGLEGPQGPAGPTGSQGPQGPQGPTGPAGEAGPQGPQGVQGQTGPTGPQGPTGPEGPAGATGPTGPAGTDGSTLHHLTTGTPSNALGKVGDFAWVDDTNNVYEKTGATQWTLRGNLGGPQGPQGIQGPTGPAGPANTLAIGTVENGQDAAASITGASPNQTLNLTLPQGLQGDIGEAGPPGPIGGQRNPTVESGVFTINPLYATDYAIIAKGNFTLAASNMRPGHICYVAIYQDGVGGRTVTLPSSWVGAQDITFTAVANQHDAIVVWRDYMGTHVKHVASGPLPAGSWSPENLDSRVAWFKADSIGGLDEDTAVGSWPNDYALATPATAFGSPTWKKANGMAYVQLDGTDYFDCDVANVSAPLTVALLVRIQQAAGEVPVISGAGLNDTNVFVDGTSPRSWQVNASGANAAVSNTNATWETVVATVNNLSGIIRRNSNEIVINTGGKGLTTVQIGRKNATNTYGTFDLAEVIVLSKVASGTEIANIETYLGNRRDQLNGLV